MQDDLVKLDAIAVELLNEFDITHPPVPVESMLQRPVTDNMWEELDVTKLSGAFLSIRDRYSPRMSLARLLVRHVAASEWGKMRGVTELLDSDEEKVKAFARMIVMPRTMVNTVSSAALNPTTLSLQFEVPEEDARLRLQELL